MLSDSTIIFAGLIAFPDWLTQGPVPVIMAIAFGVIVLLVYAHFHIKRVQRNLHELGKGYYEKERVIFNDFKAGLLTRNEYRRKHEQLVNSMREESRKFTDGP